MCNDYYERQRKTMNDRFNEICDNLIKVNKDFPLNQEEIEIINNQSKE